MCVLFGFHLVYFGTGTEVSLLLLYWTAVLGVRPLKMALYLCILYIHGVHVLWPVMGSSALQVATLLALVTFLRSDTVAPLHLIQVAVCVVKLFLDLVARGL